MSSITLENVHKVYGEETVAVEDVSVDIDDGEFLVIVGPSGSGKSTTLRMVAGLEEPTEGRIYLGGEDVTDRSARTRDVAMVFQNYALYPHMTVEENLGFGLKLSTTLDDDEIAERVREVAEMLDIDDLMHDEPGELSGGQQQRVALGRAIVRYPQAFLFDEPLSNLDAKLRAEMRTEIKQLQQELGVTSVYVTHNQEEAMTMADRVVVMHRGRVQQIAEPDEIYDHPANRFVAEFIGEPSMNVADVEASRDGNLRLRTDHAEHTFEYRLPAKIADNAGIEDGDLLTLGIRPEDIEFGTDASENVLTADVEVLEPVGSDNYHYFSVAGNEWTARTDSSDAFETGESVAYTFAPRDVYLFDESGTTLKSKGIEERAFPRQSV